jgi:hypothetical protein
MFVVADLRRCSDRDVWADPVTVADPARPEDDGVRRDDVPDAEDDSRSDDRSGVDGVRAGHLLV